MDYFGEEERQVVQGHAGSTEWMSELNCTELNRCRLTLHPDLICAEGHFENLPLQLLTWEWDEKKNRGGVSERPMLGSVPGIII